MKGTPPAADPRLLGALALLLVLAGAAGWAWSRRRPAVAVAEAADDFDTLLDAARDQTLDNPRVTADVIKLWMRA